LEYYSASFPLDEGFLNRSDTAEFFHVEFQPSVIKKKTKNLIPQEARNQLCQLVGRERRFN
jgi:hypothetical protein